MITTDTNKGLRTAIATVTAKRLIKKGIADELLPLYGLTLKKNIELMSVTFCDEKIIYKTPFNIFCATLTSD